MNDLLSGIDKFGLGSLDESKVFEEKSKTVETYTAALPAKFEINDVTYEKEFVCGVCRHKFKSRVMRLGKLQPVAIDYDLRPIYKEPIHPIFYDVHMCSNCGHTALSQTFSKLTPMQMDLVRENISPKFKPVEYPAQLDANMAIERYKLALINAVVKKAKDSEKAYICMKIAWLYRSIRDKKNEITFLAHEYKGFISALENEYFPVFGMDENTVTFISASHAKTLRFLDEALKLTGQLIVSPSVSSRLKDRARDLKEEILKEQKKKEEEQKS